MKCIRCLNLHYKEEFILRRRWSVIKNWAHSNHFFLKEQENIFVAYNDLKKRFFGLTCKDVRSLAFQLATQNGIKNNFNTNTGLAGRDWFFNFRKRHPELALRKPEATSKARVQGFNRAIVTSLFEILKRTMDKEDTYTAMRIYNVDETGITTVSFVFNYFLKLCVIYIIIY